MGRVASRGSLVLLVGFAWSASGTACLPTNRRHDESLRIRPVGGTAGCLVMILISIAASVVLTVLLNVLLR